MKKHLLLLLVLLSIFCINTYARVGIDLGIDLGSGSGGEGGSPPVTPGSGDNALWWAAGDNALWWSGGDNALWWSEGEGEASLDVEFSDEGGIAWSDEGGLSFDNL